MPLCELCGTSFTKEFNLRRHQKTVHEKQKIPCTFCDAILSSDSHLKRHIETQHRATTTTTTTTTSLPPPPPPPTTLACSKCEKVFTRADNRKSHERFCVPKRKAEATSVPAKKPTRRVIRRPKESAFDGRCQTFALPCDVNAPLDLAQFLAGKKNEVMDIVVEEQGTWHIKLNLRLLATYVKPGDDEDVHHAAFKTANRIVTPSTDLAALYDEMMDKMLAESADFDAKGSSWSLARIDELEVRINKYRPLRGGSYIELPPKLANRKAVVNVKNEDDACLVWAVLSALHPAEQHAQRVSNYVGFRSELNVTGISSPTPVNEIGRFERQNNLTINVYSCEDDLVIFPVRVSDAPHESRHIDLLLVKNEKGGSHYCWIKNLSRLVSPQLSAHHGACHICRRCLQFFQTADKLDAHTVLCLNNHAARVMMPSEEGKYLSFKNYNHLMRVPVAIYADFECIVSKLNTCEPDPSSSYTTAYQRHVPYSFAYHVVSIDGQFREPVFYRGLDAPTVFMERMKVEAEELQRRYADKRTIRILTDAEKRDFQTAAVCSICRRHFRRNDIKVRDHCHYTGDYRGPAHQECNLACKMPCFLPVFFHNLSSYDAHLFIRELGYDEQSIHVIPNTSEKYISFSKKISDRFELRFLDTYKFMAASLEKLVSNLPKDKFVQTGKFFPADKLDLVLRKGVFPYDYMDDILRCDEPSLPAKHQFYSRLNGEDISDADYEHAVTVFREFRCSSLGEYSDLYVKSDVLLLADVFENFRDVSVATYRLDPAWYYTLPGLSWDAMMCYTRVCLELLTDVDILLFIEKGIRGGISQCSLRYARANNKYMPDFDATQPSKYLMYLDSNNLYGWSMCQKLPISNFAWHDVDIDFEQLADDGDVGAILEVDLEVPQELHDFFSDYPLAPETKTPPGCAQPRLLCTLDTKRNYVVHYRSLKQYVALGLKVTKIHRVLTFTQNAFLKPYIELNTQMRIHANNKFEKDLYKLVNNSIYGKCMENIRRYINLELCVKGARADKLIAKPTFEHRDILSENLVAFRMKRSKLVFNKPIAVGMAILDVSKTLMYDFFYHVLKPTFGESVRLMYTDTDSFVILAETQDFYQHVKENSHYYDTSDYAVPNPYGIIPQNMKIPGLMKDENCGGIMAEFIGLRSKAYAYRMDSQTIQKRLKGIKRQALNSITFDNYKSCLFEKKDMNAQMNCIRSVSHQLFTMNVNKRALAWRDEKRYILLPDGIETLPYGHRDIPPSEQ